MKKIVGLLLLAAALTACVSAVSTPEAAGSLNQPADNLPQAVTLDNESATAMPATPTDEVIEDSQPDPTSAPAEATSAGTARAETAPTVETDQQPADETSEAAMAGRYEQTYFRGREDAPVTILDYSDFL